MESNFVPAHPAVIDARLLDGAAEQAKAFCTLAGGTQCRCRCASAAVPLDQARVPRCLKALELKQG